MIVACSFNALVLQIFDGDEYGDDDLLFAHCGFLDAEYYIINSNSNQVRIVFATDDENNFPGFNITHTIFPGEY